jgi:3-deoxy-7-phosphoheptulonate synthase
VETEARTMAIARAALKAGATVFRAGAFKPRTSPYEFRGLGKEALLTLAKVRSELGMPVVSEVLDTESIDMVADSVDALQVGARNMQNYSLLTALSKANKPVLLKRGLSATFEEWMLAAEYLLSGGNQNIILCERGVRTFSDHSRNTLDLNIVPAVRTFSHLPVVVDPSHGVGHRDRVRAMSRAALACGAQGLLIEAHTNPATSYTDADQTVDMATLAGIVRDRDFLAGLEKA